MAKQADWEKIEADYRAGILSLREIAGSHSITEGAIRKRAKRDGWSRDLEAKIKARADDLVRKAEVRSEVRNTGPNEREVVEANAATNASIQIQHRIGIKRAHEAVEGVRERLDSEKVDIALEKHVDVVRKYVDALRVVVSMEREAYGISGASNGSGAVTIKASSLDERI